MHDQSTAGDGAKSVIETLQARRSMPRVRPDPIPRELVERIVAAAGFAPNHYHTEPWRFIVLTGKARERLGEVMAEALRERSTNDGSPDVEAAVERERRKPLRAPVVIAVGVVPSDRPKVVEVEEIAATAAAVQNMLIAAQSLGLGAMWRTGAPAYAPAVKRFLGLPESAHVLAFVYLGYPDLVELPDRDRDALRHTTWLGWDAEDGVESSASAGC